MKDLKDLLSYTQKKPVSATNSTSSGTYEIGELW